MSQLPSAQGVDTMSWRSTKDLQRSGVAIGSLIRDSSVVGSILRLLSEQMTLGLGERNYTTEHRVGRWTEM